MNHVYRTRRSFLLKSVVISLLAVSGLLFFRPLSTGETNENSGKERQDNRSSSQTKATTQSDELTKRVNSAIEESEFATARWGISVISLADGTTVYQRDAGKLFTPASNVKIFTTGVALDLLGADYRWRTSVYAPAAPQPDGKISGDLVLYGRGAPDLSSRRGDSQSSLARLADNLYQRGVRHIDGNVIGDESYFRGNTLGDGWQWTDVQWYFGAEPSALSVNENQVQLNLLPSQAPGGSSVVVVGDPVGYMTVQNRMAAARQKVRSTIGMQRGLSDNNVQVWGEVSEGSKGFGARLSVHNPALWAAKLFVEALKARGITVAGQAEARTSRVSPAERFDPTRAVELAFLTSQPLHDIVKKTNKESNNLYAELILRTLGRERGAMLDLPEPPGRERGDDETGAALVRLWLERTGISTAGVALHDGSGLSRLNLVTPEVTVRFLLAMSKTSSGPVFLESLPVSGKDGTLAGRLKPLGDRLRAKTGYLTYTNSLSGYVTTEGGQGLVFSILCNDANGRGNSARVTDKIAQLIAAFPRNSDERKRNSQ